MIVMTCIIAILASGVQVSVNGSELVLAFTGAVTYSVLQFLKMINKQAAASCSGCSAASVDNLPRQPHRKQHAQLVSRIVSVGVASAILELHGRWAKACNDLYGWSRRELAQLHRCLTGTFDWFNELTEKIDAALDVAVQYVYTSEALLYLAN